MKIAPNQEDITHAISWLNKHTPHVERLLAAARDAYSPSGSDTFHPELWKGEHWKWLLQKEVGRQIHGPIALLKRPKVGQNHPHPTEQTKIIMTDYERGFEAGMRFAAELLVAKAEKFRTASNPTAMTSRTLAHIFDGEAEEIILSLKNGKNIAVSDKETLNLIECYRWQVSWTSGGCIIFTSPGPGPTKATPKLRDAVSAALTRQVQWEKAAMS